MFDCARLRLTREHKIGEVFITPTSHGLYLSFCHPMDRRPYCHLGRSVYPYIDPYLFMDVPLTNGDEEPATPDETPSVAWSPLWYPDGMVLGMISDQPISSATQYHGRTWIVWNYHERVWIQAIQHDVDCQTGRTIDAQYHGPYYVTRCGNESLPISDCSGSPAIVNHNEHIYVFWIDANTHYIQWTSSIDPDLSETREISVRYVHMARCLRASVTNMAMADE
jgi:hypothetical protein